jgi:GNAT superfamily N-acetyltransferase
MIRISPATAQDVPQILSFIRKLADYEKLSHAAVATEDHLHEHLFGARPMAEVVLAYWNDVPAGFALFFHNFSTFVGKPGIYLEDLFVEPEFRGHGLGKALLVHLAKIGRDRGCGRLEWSVLNWNEPAIGFYKRIGAVPLNDWTIFRLDAAGIGKLADA